MFEILEHLHHMPYLSHFYIKKWLYISNSLCLNYPVSTVVHSPSLEGLAFLIQSMRCRTKSKKKSPSGTDITVTREKHINLGFNLSLSKELALLYHIFSKESSHFMSHF